METSAGVNALTIVFAALCVFAIGTALPRTEGVGLDAARQTPVRQADGDYVATDRSSLRRCASSPLRTVSTASSSHRRCFRLMPRGRRLRSVRRTARTTSPPGGPHGAIFITIACGALSGFHATIGTGTTPKMIGKERDVLFVGYGAMLVEGFVAIMALIAACVLVPADYFAINAPADKFAALGMSVVDLPTLEKEVAESLMHRPGGSVSLAVGMAHIFGQIPWMAHLMSYWYHFAKPF